MLLPIPTQEIPLSRHPPPPILGRGAVKDTYNLLADGIRQWLRRLALVQEHELAPWAEQQGYARYLEPRIKGEAQIDWDDEGARTAFLAGIVADADGLLEQARQAQEGCAPDSPVRGQIAAAARLLGQLLRQDVKRLDEGIRLRQGVDQDRIVSVHDPEMRHGRKSRSARFDGHKAAVAVEPAPRGPPQLITAVAVLPGNAPAARGALALVEQSEQHTALSVTEVMADAAYGDGRTRQAFAQSNRTLIAKVRKRPRQSHFPKQDFTIDLATPACTCPAGQVTTDLRSQGHDPHVDKGISGAGIGSGIWIDGPAPRVAGPGAAQAPVSGSVRAERPRGGGQCRWGGTCGAEDRGGRGVERAMSECDAGPAPRARVGSGAAGVHPAQARAEVGTGRRAQPHAGPQTAA